MPRSSRWSAGHEQNRCIEPHSCSQLARGLYISAIFYSVMKMTNVKDLLSPSLLDKPIEKPAKAKAVEPAKRWRNKWKANAFLRVLETGERYSPGQIYWGKMDHPSKEVAEQRALEDLAEDLRQGVPSFAQTYLGAHPIPEGE